MRTVIYKIVPAFVIALGFAPSAALADYQNAPTVVYTTGTPAPQPYIFKAVPSVGVPAQADVPIRGRAFAANKGVFEVRGEFDPDSPGEEWSTVPAMRIVIDADGSRRRVKAGPEHYTAVRWRETGTGRVSLN